MNKTILLVAWASSLAVSSHAHPGAGLDPGHAVVHLLDPAPQGWAFCLAIATMLWLLAGARYTQRTM